MPWKKWECKEWHVVDETGMIQKGKNKASNQKSIERG